MWNSRFAALQTIPSTTVPGSAPAPEGLTLSYLPHLLAAQAFIPPTERVEVAGFHFPGDNFDIRDEVLRRINAVPDYRARFARSFRSVRNGSPVTFDMFGLAIAEFEFTLVRADAPVDRFARGLENALTDEQKRGALLFFGKARCVRCHQVSGLSNEMFSDFAPHVIAVPQIAPLIGNVAFDGPDANEDFGLEQVTGNPDNRYKFRTSPLRNVGLQPTFFHNGAFTILEDAVRHHLDVFTSTRDYRRHRALASHPISTRRWDRVSRCLRESIPSWRSRFAWATTSSGSWSISSVTACWTGGRARRICGS